MHQSLKPLHIRFFHLKTHRLNPLNVTVSPLRLRGLTSTTTTQHSRKKTRLNRPLVFKPYFDFDSEIVHPSKSVPTHMSGTAGPASDDRSTPFVGEIRSLSDVENEGELRDVKKPRLDPSQDKDSDGKKKLAKKIRKKDRLFPDRYTPEDVLWQDILSVIGGRDVLNEAVKEGIEFDSPFDAGDVVQVEVVSLSSTGEAIALPTRRNISDHPWVIVTRFCLPDETVRVRVYWNKRLHSYADLIEVKTPNLELRDNSRIKCRYFGQCGGCQYQMLSYDQQLKLKRDVIVKAYQNFSDLPGSSVPVIQNTISSPLQYGYRTKLTPHFDAPPKGHRKEKAEIVDGKAVKPEWLNIGFNKAGTHRVIDIEECPISTKTLNDALPAIRENVYRNIHRYEKGVSLTLRDSLPIPTSDSSETTNMATSPADSEVDDLSAQLDQHHICISDPKSSVREKIGEWIFEYNANSFFQNNNSVLVPLTEYVRDVIFPPTSSSNTITRGLEAPTHLVDAYCGAGLFSITLSPYFDHIAGIELSRESIKSAQHNATLNSIPSSKITFRAGDAGDLFSTVQHDFPPSRTVLVIDPPRKGCDDNFIRQVLDFRCGTIVYVSCNVHTQARDVGRLVSETKGDGEGRRYVIESVRGFDLFPQTAHVEGVAVLRLV